MIMIITIVYRVDSLPWLVSCKAALPFCNHHTRTKKLKRFLLAPLRLAITMMANEMAIALTNEMKNS